MSLNVGSRIAHYDVTALIGEGGMDQVYQAAVRQTGGGCGSHLQACVTQGRPLGVAFGLYGRTATRTTA